MVSSDAIGALPIKLIAALTEWKDRQTGSSWHVRTEAAYHKLPEHRGALAWVTL